MTCTQATLLSLSIAAALGCIGAARAQQTASVQATEATTLDQVLVSGRLRSLEQFTPTGSRLNLSARETPGTLDAINAAAIEARGLRSVEKAAESLPGINTGGSPGNPATFSMRGFTDGQITILHNGLYLGPSNMTNRPQNTFNLQSVEVLKGPASVIYGQGAVGGAVNVTNKAPTFGPAQYELLLGASSYGGRVFGVGAGGGINDDWAYRADISQVSSDGYVHGADSSALNATVSLLWHPREDISAQFSLDYAKDQPSTYFGTPLLPAAAARTPINGILRAPNGEVVDAATRRNNYNVADASIDARQLWPQAYLKWKVTDAVTVQNMAYYFHADRRWINAENYTYNPQSARIERDRFFVYHQQTLWGNQTSATFDQRIAGLKNRLVVGLDYSRLDFDRNRGFPRATAWRWTRAGQAAHSANACADAAPPPGPMPRCFSKMRWMSPTRQNWYSAGATNISIWIARTSVRMVGFRRHRVSRVPIARPMAASVWSTRSPPTSPRTRPTPPPPIRLAPISSLSMRGRTLH